MFQSITVNIYHITGHVLHVCCFPKVGPHVFAIASLQDAFEVLAENYEFNGMEGQCLAFRRAASVLKSLSWEVRSSERVHELPCLGETMEELVEVSFRFGMWTESMR